MKQLRKVSNSRYVGIATSCFCLAFCFVLARAMLPGLEPTQGTAVKKDRGDKRKGTAELARTPQTLHISPPRLIRSAVSGATVVDFSDNGVILLLTSERAAIPRTYELMVNGKRTPVRDISGKLPVMLSPKGRPFERPLLVPGRDGSAPVQLGSPGPGTVWSPALAGPRYVRRFYEDGSFLVAISGGSPGDGYHIIGRTKDGKFVEQIAKIKEYQGVLDRTSKDAVWVVSGKASRGKNLNTVLTRIQNGVSANYPVPSSSTLVNRIGEGGGVIAGGMFDIKINKKEQVLTYENGKWVPLPLPEGLRGARLTKVFDSGWILGEGDDPDHSVILTVLWKNKVPIVLNDLPGWPKNGTGATVVGSSCNGDIYVRSYAGTSFGSEEYYLIHLRE